MPKKASKPDNRHSNLMAAAGLGTLAVAYLSLFFRQPSSLGLPDENGDTLDRLTDLLVMPVLIPGIWGFSEVPSSWFDKLPVIIFALGWLSLGCWIGRPLVEASLGSTTRWTSQWSLRLSLSALTGLALLSTVTLLLGIIGLLNQRLWLAAAIALMAVAAWWLGRRSKETSQSIPDTDRLAHTDAPVHNQPTVWFSRLIPMATLVTAATYLWGGGLPPMEFDVLEYHLQAPKEFWQAGQIGFVPHNVYANMPLGTEMHSLAAMVLIGGDSGWWWGGLAGKCITSAYALLAASVAGSFTATYFGRRTGWACAGLIVGTAGFMHVSMAGLIDVSVGAYLIAGLIVASTASGSFAKPMPSSVEAAEKGASTNKEARGNGAATLLVGILSGAAVACKYPSILFAFLPCFALLVIPAFSKKDWRRVGIIILCFAIGASVTWIPWCVKNMAFTGNPVYPLLNGVFGAVGMTAEGIENWNRVHRPNGFSVSDLLHSARQLLVGSTFLNPILSFFAILGALGLLLFRSDEVVRQHRFWLLSWLGVAIWGIAIWWFATHRIDRFWLPLLPIGAVFAAVCFHRLAHRISATLATGLVLIGVGFGCLQAISGASPHDHRYAVALSHLASESQGIAWSQNAGDDLTAAPASRVAWLNENLGESDHLLAIGEAKAFLFRHRVQYATCFNSSPAEALLSSGAIGERQQRLADAQITHVLINWSEIARYRSPGNYGFSNWPIRADIDELSSGGLLREVETPFPSSEIALYRVVTNSGITD